MFTERLLQVGAVPGTGDGESERGRGFSGKVTFGQRTERRGANDAAGRASAKAPRWDRTLCVPSADMWGLGRRHAYCGNFRRLSKNTQEVCGHGALNKPHPV